MVSRTEESSLSKDKKFCECGCGTLMPIRDKYGIRRRYINGHQLLGHKVSEETRAKMKAKKLKAKQEGRGIGPNHPCWKGGRYLDASGYVRVWVGDSHPRANKGTIREHVLVMEQHLGRYLESYELVHHINEIKVDNRIENLLLANKPKHMTLHEHKRDAKTGRFIH